MDHLNAHAVLMVILSLESPDIPALVEDLALRRLVNTHDEFAHGGFTAAAFPYHCNDLSLVNGKIHPGQGLDGILFSSGAAGKPNAGIFKFNQWWQDVLPPSSAHKGYIVGCLPGRPFFPGCR